MLATVSSDLKRISHFTVYDKFDSLSTSVAANPTLNLQSNVGFNRGLESKEQTIPIMQGHKM